MPKHHNQGNTAVEEQAAEQVAEQTSDIVAEEPKTKTGDKDESPKTVVEGKTGESKPRAARIPQTATYRVMDGVDSSKWTGQRSCIVKSLQKLANDQGSDKFFTVKQIADNVENFTARVPVEASVAWHLKYLVKDGFAAVNTQSAPTEEKAAA